RPTTEPRATDHRPKRPVSPCRNTAPQPRRHPLAVDRRAGTTATPLYRGASRQEALDCGPHDRICRKEIPADTGSSSTIPVRLLGQLGPDPRRPEVPGRKRLEIDYGQPIRAIIA